MKIEANENGIQGICSQFPPAKKPRDKQEVLDVLYSPPPRSCDTQQLKRVLILNGGLQIIGIIVRSDVSVFTRMEGLRQQNLSIVGSQQNIGQTLGENANTLEYTHRKTSLA